MTGLFASRREKAEAARDALEELETTMRRATEAMQKCAVALQSLQMAMNKQEELNRDSVRIISKLKAERAKVSTQATTRQRGW